MMTTCCPHCFRDNLYLCGGFQKVGVSQRRMVCKINNLTFGCSYFDKNIKALDLWSLSQRVCTPD